MVSGNSSGFRREDLRTRYDVSTVHEDRWHSYTDSKTKALLARYLGHPNRSRENWLLNAGAGVYQIGYDGWLEIDVDLFATPIAGMARAVCANIQELPFPDGWFDAVVCVGEVLAYCDPPKAIRELARVLAPGGRLICDFGSTLGFRHWLRPTLGKAAALIEVEYNGLPEKTWVYDPRYIRQLMKRFGFRIRAQVGTHSWSALARRLGFNLTHSLATQRAFEWLPLATPWSETITLVADRETSST